MTHFHYTHEEREVLHAALHRRAIPLRTDRLIWTGAALTAHNNASAAFYATADALMGILGGPMPAYGVSAINALVEMLGAEARVIREDHGWANPNEDLRDLRYYYDGTRVEPGVPFLIAGPMAVMAYRATYKSLPWEVWYQAPRRRRRCAPHI